MLKILNTQSSINAEVLSFARIAHRVSLEVGGYTEVNLSKAGKAMILSSILAQYKSDLKFLGNNSEDIDIALRLISELKKHNVYLNNIDEAINETEDMYLKTKLSDISVIYGSYEKLINERFIDEEDELSILAKQLKESSMFQDSYIYIDEFVGFTAQEYSIIKELIKQAKEVNITICTDSLEPNINRETDIFAPSKRVVKKIVQAAGVAKIKEVHVKEDGYKSTELKHLEQNIYKNVITQEAKYEKSVKDINLLLTQNPYSEVENVAKNIIKLVRDEDYSYKDIAVITKNMDEYESLTRAIFSSYGIPFFIDKNGDLSTNILVRYILSILEIFEKNWSSEAVFSYVKTGFLNIEKNHIYLLENFCNKWGIRGKKWHEKWEYDDKNIELMNELRIKIVKPLIDLKEQLQSKRTTNEITKKLYDFLENNHIIEQLNKKIEILKEANEIVLAKEYKQSWEILIEIFDELTMVFGEEKITFEKYKELLKIGLTYSDLGKIPTTIDQVLLADVDRSKPKNQKIVFILGLNDGRYPSVNKNEGFLNDKDRNFLEEINIEMANGTLDNLYEEQLNIYKILSLADEKLFLSYVSSDKSGGTLRPSILIAKIKKIFPKLQEKSDIVNKETEITTQTITFKELLFNLRKQRDGEQIDEIWENIYLWFNENQEWKENLRIALKGLKYDNEPENISNANIKKLYGETLNVSVSKLEQYKKCPFSFHLKYGMKLKEQEEFNLNPIDTGSFMHDIIDSFFQEYINYKELNEKQIEEAVNKIIDNKLNLKKNYKFTSTPKFIVLTNRLKTVILKAIKYIVEQMKNSSFEILGSEVEFKQKYDNVELTGKIDRMDVGKNEDGEYIRIIDYKSSTKQIDLNEMLAGVQIQLLTYIDSIANKYKKIPAGVLYYNLIDPIIKSKKNLTEEEIEEKIRKEFRMKGLVLADIKVIKMMDKTLETGTSTSIPISINKSGEISKLKSDIVTKEEFTKLREMVNKIIKQISNEILKGNIELKPMYNKKTKKATCEYCEYRTICGFNPNYNSYNFIGNKTKEEILNN